MSTAAVSVTQNNFETEVLEASRTTTVLIDFWAPWCGPCRQLNPILDRVVADHAGQVKLVKVNTDEEMGLAGAFGIRSLPTVVVMKNGQPVDGFMGLQPEGAIRALLARHVGPAQVEEELPEELEAAQDLDLDERIAALEAQVDAAGDKEEPRVELADAYAQSGRLDEAEAQLALLKTLADSDGAKRAQVRIKFVRALSAAPSAVELEQAIAQDGSNLKARWQLGLRFVAAGQYAAGMDQFLTILKTDRKFEDDLGRKTLVDTFRLVDDEDLVGTYRRKLTSMLF